MSNMRIKELLEQIQQLYPAERIAKTKQRFLQVWNTESPDDPPLLAQSWFSVFWPPDALNDRSHYEPEKRLQFQLEGIVARGCIADDFIPSLFPDDRVSVIASAFGCKIDDRQGEHQWVHPLISKPEDVYSIEKPEIGACGLSEHVLNTIRYFREATGGAIPIRSCDVQGPMSVASMIMGMQNFLEALYTHPKQVHDLLDIVTDTIADFYFQMFEAAGNDFIPTHVVPSAWMPQDKGVALSDDLMPVISPEHYVEYALPQHEKIASEFGGIMLHSCGDAARSIEAILSTRGLTGLHLGQMCIKKLAPLINGRVPIIPACQTDLEDWDLVGKDQVRDAIEICKNGIYAILVVGAGGDIEKEARLIDAVRN